MKTMQRQWLKDLRLSKKLTQSEVAQKANLTQHYLSEIENGNRNVPVHTAKKIANILIFDWQIFYE